MGTLFVVATPIGNLEDISSRALQTLRDVSMIAAEDTRHSRKLLTHFGITTPLVSYHEHNVRERREPMLRALAQGDVAIITDAGTPAISDPGNDLVAAAREAGFPVSPIPGPSSVTAAVSVSGLVDGPFVVLGFLPRENPERRERISQGAVMGWPMVVLESPHRLEQTIRELAGALGNRRAVVCRELTKLHEEVLSGTLESLQDWAASARPRGEVILVIAGASREEPSADDAASVVEMLRRSGLSASHAAREAAAITGLPRSDLYRMATAVDLTESVGLEGQFSASDEDALEDALGNEKRPE